MLYLGLGPDDEYDDFEVTGEHQRPAARPPARRPPVGEVQHDPEPSGAVRTLQPSPGDEQNGQSGGRSNGHDHGTGQNTARGSDRSHLEVAGPSGRRTASARPSGRDAVVRPLPAGSSKPFVVGPTSFNDAQDVADKFKVNVPVILNLQGVERDLARRIIDFASGLCYGLGGQMERVANQVYLLTPSDVEVSPEERRRLRERGYEA
jgi:cell division inhibitor SepF